MPKIMVAQCHLAAIVKLRGLPSWQISAHSTHESMSKIIELVTLCHWSTSCTSVMMFVRFALSADEFAHKFMPKIMESRASSLFILACSLVKLHGLPSWQISAESAHESMSKIMDMVTLCHWSTSQISSESAHESMSKIIDMVNLCHWSASHQCLSRTFGPPSMLDHHRKQWKHHRKPVEHHPKASPKTSGASPKAPAGTSGAPAEAMGALEQLLGQPAKASGSRQRENGEAERQPPKSHLALRREFLLINWSVELQEKIYCVAKMQE